VVGDWTKWPILVCVGIIVDGFGSNNLTKIIMNTLLKVGGWPKKILPNSFYALEQMGWMSFKGKIKMTKQIKDLWAQFSMGVHCVDVM
jgi:hypothetical protein